MHLFFIIALSVGDVVWVLHCEDIFSWGVTATTSSKPLFEPLIKNIITLASFISIILSCLCCCHQFIQIFCLTCTNRLDVLCLRPNSGRLVIVRKGLVNLAELPIFSPGCLSPPLIRLSYLLTSFLRTPILKTKVILYLLYLLELVWNYIIPL